MKMLRGSISIHEDTTTKEITAWLMGWPGPPLQRPFRSAEDKDRVVQALRKLADQLAAEEYPESVLVRPALKPGDRVRIVDYLDYAHKDKKSAMVLEVLPHGKRMRVVEIDGQEARAPLPVGLAYDVPVTQAHWDDLVRLVNLERL